MNRELHESITPPPLQIAFTVEELSLWLKRVEHGIEASVPYRDDSAAMAADAFRIRGVALDFIRIKLVEALRT